MKITVSILVVGLAALTACGSTADPRPAAAVAAAATGQRVTVVGTGTAAGTPDQASMSFGVDDTAGRAAAALSEESAAARKLIDALKAAGIAEADIQTQYLSLYFDPQRRQFEASSAVTAKIRSLSRAGSIIDASVGAAGDSIRLNGISLSIGDTSALMASARKQAVSDAAARARQYAEAAGLRLGSIVSISEQANVPSPVFYGAQVAAPAAQPIEAGTQTLEVSVTVVYNLTQ